MSAGILAALLRDDSRQLRTGMVTAILPQGRYQVTDSQGRRYEVRSAAVLGKGSQVRFQDGVVVAGAGQAQAMKVFEV